MDTDRNEKKFVFVLVPRERRWQLSKPELLEPNETPDEEHNVRGPFSMREMEQMWDYGLITSSTFYAISSSSDAALGNWEYYNPRWERLGGLLGEFAGIRKETIPVPPDYVNPLREKQRDYLYLPPPTPAQAEHRRKKIKVTILTLSHSVVSVVPFALLEHISWGSAIMLGVYLFGWVLYLCHRWNQAKPELCRQSSFGWMAATYWVIAVAGTIGAVLSRKVDGGVFCAGMFWLPLMYLFSSWLCDNFNL